MGIAVVVGCAKNPYILQGEVSQLKQAQQTMQASTSEMQARAQRLDQDNQELETLVAQTRQQSRLLEDEVTALREQLRTAAAQLTRARDEALVQASKPDPAATTAATPVVRPKPRVQITANSSLQNNLPTFNIPGVEVRFDGDVVRVEIAADSLFYPADTQMQNGSKELLTEVGSELARRYPAQRIGIEGHTDNDPLPPGSRWGSAHHLSTARASMVYDVLITHTRLQSQQLFVAGHGANHPVVSNATAPGKQRNRRIELVVYPERAVE